MDVLLGVSRICSTSLFFACNSKLSENEKKVKLNTFSPNLSESDFLSVKKLMIDMPIAWNAFNIIHLHSSKLSIFLVIVYSHENLRA